MEKIGLIAGSGKFPLIFSQYAKARGRNICAVAVKGETSKELEDLVDRVYWVEVGQLERLFKIFKDEGITRAIMAGKISPTLLLKDDLAVDEELKELLDHAKDKRADSLLGAVARRLKKAGIDLIDSTTYLSDLLPHEGILTQRQPSQAEWEDIRFGFDIARKIAGLDIGQTVVVKDKAILAIEAIEGTDEAIRRGGALGNGEVVVVKVSKPKQDMRFDIPVVGPETIRSLTQAKASCLAIEAQKTLLIDKEEVVRLADRSGISVAVI